MKIKIFALVLVSVLCSTVAFGQEEQPMSWNAKKLRPIDKFEFIQPLPDSVIKKKTEEWDNAEFKLYLYRHEVEYNLLNSGQWDTLEDGSRIWRLALILPKSMKISHIYFDTFLLSKQSFFFIYNYSKKELLTGISSYQKLMERWNWHIEISKKYKINAPADTSIDNSIMFNKQAYTLVLEYNIPASTKEQGTITIKTIHEERIPKGKDIGLKSNNDDCHVNISCPEGVDWQLEKNAVVRRYFV